MQAHRQNQGAAVETIFAVGGLPGELSGRGRRGAAGDRVRGAVTELIGDIEVKSFSLVPGADAEKIPVHVGGERGVILVRHRVLVEDVAAAHMPAIVEIPRHAKLIHPAPLPAQVHRDVLVKGIAHRRW